MSHSLVTAEQLCMVSDSSLRCIIF